MEKKKKKEAILNLLAAGLFISFLRQFQERWLLGRGSRIPFCMQISVLNWMSYGLMTPGQQQQYLASPFAVIIRWPWDLPNQGSTVTINITFSRIVFSGCTRDNPSEELIQLGMPSIPSYPFPLPQHWPSLTLCCKKSLQYFCFSTDLLSYLMM